MATTAPIERRARVLHGDCLTVLAGLDAESVDAVVTDPPYHLTTLSRGGSPRQNDPATPFGRTRLGSRGFMGKTWDGGGLAFDPATWDAIGRVLKPGGHLLAFGGTRTYHRLTCAIEDAGFEVRDCLMWIYGSGFPKSLDVSKAIDKAAGAEREATEQERVYPDGKTRGVMCAMGGRRGQAASGYRPTGDLYPAERQLRHYTIPATDAARRWQGWGTALKPAYEPIVLARKPLAGTVAANVQQYGTGAINVDGCRIPAEPELAKNWDRSSIADMRGGKYGAAESGAMPNCWQAPTGRWPANVLHDGSDEVVALFPANAGGGSATIRHGKDAEIGAYAGGGVKQNHGREDTAARFFYTAKASRRERGDGNTHPTVKPLALMRYLCKLITPPDGLILDPFAGSGSTGCAAVSEGFRFVGIEQDGTSVQTADKRTVETEFLPLERFLLHDDA